MLYAWPAEGSSPLDGIPLEEINGGCQRETSNSLTNKKRTDSRTDRLEATCQLMSGSGDWSGFGKASTLQNPHHLGQ